MIKVMRLFVSASGQLDAKQLAFNPVVEISYLSFDEQNAVLAGMEKH
jgi:hypothetical protein